MEAKVLRYTSITPVSPRADRAGPVPAIGPG